MKFSKHELTLSKSWIIRSNFFFFSRSLFDCLRSLVYGHHIAKLLVIKWLQFKNSVDLADYLMLYFIPDWYSLYISWWDYHLKEKRRNFLRFPLELKLNDDENNGIRWFKMVQLLEFTGEEVKLLLLLIVLKFRFSFSNNG